ncbi:MAG: hypothetical protein GC191_16635 [Azospirillum sp.]|nr:hypothetical protein [Azospirillum sp.]
MVTSGEVVRNQQSSRLLEELLALSLEERWRMMIDRDLRLRRLTDEDFALFCRGLGIRPPAGMTGFGPEWGLPVPLEADWAVSADHTVDTGRRRGLGTVVKLLAVALLIGLVATQVLILSWLSSGDQSNQQIASLERTTEQLNGAVAATAKGADTGARLAAQAVSDLDRLRLAVVMEQLRDALETGRPFAGALGVVTGNARVPESLRVELTALAPYAQTGIRTDADLRQQFGDLLGPAFIAGQDVSLGAATCRELGAFLSLDLCNLRERNGRSILLHQAETAIARDDFGGAIAILNRLSPPALVVVRPWIAAATARIAADRGIAAISREIFAP